MGNPLVKLPEHILVGVVEDMVESENHELIASSITNSDGDVSVTCTWKEIK